MPATRPPRRLTIGHATFTVRADVALCDENNADGLMDGGGRQIIYRPGMAPDRRREVLIHEALHACVEVSRGHGLDVDTEEAVVDAVAGAVLSLIRNNPDFLTYLATP